MCGVGYVDCCECGCVGFLSMVVGWVFSVLVDYLEVLECVLYDLVVCGDWVCLLVLLDDDFVEIGSFGGCFDCVIVLVEFLVEWV